MSEKRHTLAGNLNPILLGDMIEEMGLVDLSAGYSTQHGKTTCV